MAEHRPSTSRNVPLVAARVLAVVLGLFQLAGVVFFTVFARDDAGLASGQATLARAVTIADEAEREGKPKRRVKGRGDPIIEVEGTLLALRKETAGCLCVRLALAADAA